MRLTIIILVLFFSQSYAQTEKSEYVEYSISYRFKDGFYLNHNDFLQNSPIPFESVVNPDFKNQNFIENFKNAKSVSYFNEFGNLTQISSKDIWGYAYNGRPHIHWAGDYNLIPYIGQVSHFVATIRVIYDNYHSGFHDPYFYRGTRPVRYHDEIRQFLIDFETGKILDFNVDNIKFILQRDRELMEEFDGLRKRRKERMKFYYLRQFNERNPLYLPIK